LKFGHTNKVERAKYMRLLVVREGGNVLFRRILQDEDIELVEEVIDRATSIYCG